MSIISMIAEGHWPSRGPYFSKDVDPYWDKCVLALRCDGADGSTAFTDLSPSGHAVASYGTVAVSTSQSLFYGSSAYFPNSGDGLSVADSPDFAINGTNALTARVQVRPSSSSGTSTRFLFDKDGVQGSAYPNWAVYYNNTGIYFLIGRGGVNDPSNTYQIVAPVNICDDQWHDVVAVINKRDLYLLVDGVLKASGNAGGTIISSSNTRNLQIGYENSAYAGFIGYMQDVQVYKGVALHTSSFTPSPYSMPVKGQDS